MQTFYVSVLDEQIHYCFSVFLYETALEVCLYTTFNNSLLDAAVKRHTLNQNEYNLNFRPK